MDKIIKKLNVRDLSTDEREKIMSMLSKDKSGQDDTKWMYEEPKANPEEFLLGKKIKGVKDIIELRKAEATQGEDETPEARFARLDMRMKFREDPLTLMKQAEHYIQDQCLQNTAKMKKLQRLLEMQNSKKDKKEKKKKKHKNSKKHKSDSKDSSGDELLEEFIKIVRNQDFNKSLDSESRMPDYKSPQSSHIKKHKHKSPEKRDSSPVRKRSYHTDKTQSDYRREYSSRVDSSKRSNYRDRSSHEKQRISPYKSSKLSREEMDKKRAEMISDAHQREQIRSERTKDYKDRMEKDYARQREEQSKHGAGFVKNMTLNSVSSMSLEESVNRNFVRHQKSAKDDRGFIQR